MKSPYKEYPLVISFNFLVPIYNNITPTRVTKTKKNGILILDQVVPSLPRAKDRYSINCYKKYNFFPILNQSSVLFGPGRGLRNIIVLFYEVHTHLPLLVSFHEIPFKEVGGAKLPRKGAITCSAISTLFRNRGRDMSNIPSSLYMTCVRESIWYFITDNEGSNKILQFIAKHSVRVVIVVEGWWRVI